MIKNYITIAWRNLVRNKVFSIIKITGLSLGLMVCMLIMLYTKDEVSYDRFHKNHANIYRVGQQWQFGQDQPMNVGVTNAPLAEVFKEQIPEIRDFVRVNGTTVTVKKGNDVFTEKPIVAEKNFFEVFAFKLLKGAAGTVLANKNSLVLTEDVANKYFGTQDVIGKTMEIQLADKFEPFVISGLAKNPPQNSSLRFSFIIPFEYYKDHLPQKNWVGGSLNTFVILNHNVQLSAVEKKMTTVLNTEARSELEKAKKDQGIDFKINLLLQPITEMHLSKKMGPDNLHSEGSNSLYSYILSFIGIFILVIACINFVNLAIAQSLKRSKEIGIRKVVGSSRKQLIKQFLVESFVVSLIAFGIAIILTVIILPFFNDLANKKLSLSYLSDGYLYAGLFLLLVTTSFVAGVYPSLILSKFQPVKVLYSKQKLLGRNYLTRGLVVLQFSLAVFLIIGTLAVHSQLKFLLKQDLGYDSRNLMKFDLPYLPESNRMAAIFKNDLKSNPNIIQIAGKNGGRNITGVRTTPDSKVIEIDYSKIDENYLPTFKIPLRAGRNFSPSYSTDTANAVIVNESLVKEAGWKAEEAVGKNLYLLGMNRRVTIVGVIRNYNYTSLKEKILPQVLTMDPAYNYGEIWLRIRPDNVQHTLASIEKKYKSVNPLFPYQYEFMEDINAQYYATEEKWKSIIGIAAAMFIFISCMGLFGLVLLSIEQRTKEIGIRKVLGAAVSRIFLLISKDFLKLIVLAFLIAIPAGYYVVTAWLQDFPYRINISAWMFVLAGIMILAIALFTISVQAMRAALANPVKSLRTD